MRIGEISNSVIRRLPRYYRFLGELKSKGIAKISSGELSKRMGLTASQIRQDFNCFGEFGQQGYGYNVEILQSEIGKILGLERPKNAVLIGVGNLGRAVAQHVNFASLGYSVIGLFDHKESLIGQTVKDTPIRSISVLDEFCRENKPEVAVLCIPKSAAASITEQLIKLGVKGFWNFSHYDIALNFPDVSVENVHFTDSLMTLSYKLANKNK
ncbi:MAG: redox-sensing transcriptional repressor Rex [Clostridia bacterium]|nr:redox-sensing transcriptional repressor Rex [Clostridia bacterium]